MSFFRFNSPVDRTPSAPAEGHPIVDGLGRSSPADDAEQLLAAIRAHVTELLGEEDPEFVQDLVDTFGGSAHGLVVQAQAARDSGDLEAIGKVAHQLKGSASNVGLTDLEQVWHRVEAGARAGDPTALGLPLADAIAQTEQAARLLGA